MGWAEGGVRVRKTLYGWKACSHGIVESWAGPWQKSILFCWHSTGTFLIDKRAGRAIKVRQSSGATGSSEKSSAFLGGSENRSPVETEALMKETQGEHEFGPSEAEPQRPGWGICFNSIHSGEPSEALEQACDGMKWSFWRIDLEESPMITPRIRGLLKAGFLAVFVHYCLSRTYHCAWYVDMFWMNEWRNGWIDGWMDRQTGWMAGWCYVRISSWGIRSCNTSAVG